MAIISTGKKADANDPLHKLSKIIREAREAKSLGIQELSQLTKVSVKYLVAIEDACREELPEEVYLTGFLNIIAKKLDIDKELIREYKDSEAGFVLQNIVNDTPNSRAAKEPLFKIYHLYIFAFLLLAVFAALMIFKQPQEKEITPKASPQQESLERPKAPTKSPQKSINDKIAQIPKTSGRYKLVLKVVGNAWMQITTLSNNEIVYEGKVSPQLLPDAVSFRDNLGILMVTANAGAFDVDTGNGFYHLGNRGQPLKWYYPPSAKVAARR